jgi:hypothetical protein
MRMFVEDLIQFLKSEIELDSLSFLKNTSNCGEQTKKEEDISRRKEKQ